MKKMKKKLTLNRETLRTMTSGPLAAVVGGTGLFGTCRTCQSCFQPCTDACSADCQSVDCPTPGC